MWITSCNWQLYKCTYITHAHVHVSTEFSVCIRCNFQEQIKLSCLWHIPMKCLFNKRNKVYWEQKWLILFPLKAIFLSLSMQPQFLMETACFESLLMFLQDIFSFIWYIFIYVYTILVIGPPTTFGKTDHEENSDGEILTIFPSDVSYIQKKVRQEHLSKWQHYLNKYLQGQLCYNTRDNFSENYVTCNHIPWHR